MNVEEIILAAIFLVVGFGFIYLYLRWVWSDNRIVAHVAKQYSVCPRDVEILLEAIKNEKEDS